MGRSRVARSRWSQNLHFLPKHRRVKRRCLRHFYRRRRKVENFFRKLFDFRRIPIRYEKLAGRFLALVHLTWALILVRNFVNTPWKTSLRDCTTAVRGSWF